MKSFNKNWLAIILIAVVFFLLGYLLGKTSHHHKNFENHKMMKFIEKSDCTSKDMQVDVDVEKILDNINIEDINKDSSNIIVIKKIK